jgi:NADPH:quinone reductase-like Zn-dependent oxidoreductase
MKAVRIHAFGGPEVLRLDELALPVPGAGELLIKVAGAGINPVDYKIRQGGYPKITEAQLPITLGRDIAGIVQSGAELGGPFKNGDEIFALLNWTLGGYAQYAVVPVSNCAAKPPVMAVRDSGAVPLAGLTAWQGIFDHGGLHAGQRILIHGGAGGVGHFAVQFAKSRGAYVATTVSGEDAEFVSALGADMVIDRKAQRFEDIAKEMDVVYDLIGGETRGRSWGVLKRGGILVSTLGQPDSSVAAAHGVRAQGYTAQPNAGQLAQIGDLINAAKVRPVVTRTFGLAEAAQAHRYLEEQHPRGKVVFDVGSETVG